MAVIVGQGISVSPVADAELSHESTSTVQNKVVTDAIASEYSTSKTYSVGDVCTHDGKLYECIVDIPTAEGWTLAHWKVSNLGDNVSNLNRQISAMNGDKTTHPTSMATDVSITGTAVAQYDNGRIKVYGTTGTARRLLCFNPTWEAVSTAAVFRKTLSPGTYKIHAQSSLTSYDTTIRITETTFASEQILRDGAIFVADAPVMLGLLLVGNYDFGTEDSPTYFTLSIDQYVEKADQEDFSVIAALANNVADYTKTRGAGSLLEMKNVSPVDRSGIIYSAENGVYAANGTATATSFLAIDGTANQIPDWIASAEGKNVYIEYETESPLYLDLRLFNSDYPSGLRILHTKHNTSVKIPDLTDYSGAQLRLQCASGSVLDNVQVKPQVFAGLSNEQLSQSFNYGYRDPMLTIIDDDGDVHFSIDLVPIIQDLHVPITSAVTTTRIQAAEDGTSNRWMTWNQIRDCAEKGAEIVCHMYSHPNAEQIEAMSEPEIQHRLFMAKNYLKANGVDSNVLVYSYSTGTSEAGVKLQHAAQYVFDCAFAVNGGTPDTTSPDYNGVPVFPTSDRFLLPRYRIDLTYDYDLATMKSIIDDIAANGGWAVWMIHTSSGTSSKGYWRAIDDGTGHPDPNAEADTDGTKNYIGKTVVVPKLREAIAYAQTKGVPLVTAEYGLKKYFAQTGNMH